MESLEAAEEGPDDDVRHVLLPLLLLGRVAGATAGVGSSTGAAAATAVCRRVGAEQVESRDDRRRRDRRRGGDRRTFPGQYTWNIYM